MRFERQMCKKALSAGLLFLLLAAGCTIPSEPPVSPLPPAGQETATPSPPPPTSEPTPPPSTAAPTPYPTASPVPSPTPTPRPIAWSGPLLYPEWGLEGKPLPLYDLGSRQAHTIATNRPALRILGWSPDGCTLAYLTTGDTRWEIRLLDLGSLQEQHLTTVVPFWSDPRWGWTPLQWSPDGTWNVPG